jgi:hypothetical protein
MKAVTRVVLGVALAMGLGACGKIPKEFRGKYVDDTHRMALELKAQGGSWAREGEVAREFQAKAMKVESLARGESGIYLRSIGDEDSGSLEVFWVQPDPSTIQEQYGFVSLRAQILYTRFKLGARIATEQLLARFCDEGQILIDRSTQAFTGGCPADSLFLQLRKVP